ncbi:MAG: LysM peptidoglycan-binding domain-containing protein [Anaerolineales bacterium]|nr:LysM peptidoglycan-binding domain-containing protein [Anaerolineales bacterium]
MSSKTSDSYLTHPFYKLAIQHLQAGEWEIGLRKVDWLLENFPLEHDLRSLRQDILLRAKLSKDEKRDIANLKRRRITKFMTRSLSLILLSVILIWGISTVSASIQEKVEVARQRLANEIQLIELSAKLRDAESLLRAGRVEDAKILLSEIEAVDPEFPNLHTALIQAESASSVDAQYAEALRFIEAERWSDARRVLRELQVLAPNYRDVAILLEDVERNSLIHEILAQAELDYVDGQWEAAVTGFERIRAIDPEFKPETMVERLFESYVNAARFVLVGQADSLLALETAEKYFRSALALKPQNPEIKTERELARLFLNSQAYFVNAQWNEVITDLEIVNAEDPDYAMGTARQTLFEAYIARGDERMENGDYELALADYERATVLAEQDPEAILRLYEAHLKVADAQGAQGNFETAVLHYRTAVEISDLKERSQINDPIQANALREAERYVEEGNYSVAYERYRNALGIIPGSYCLSFGTYEDSTWFTSGTHSTITYVVKSGEYLTLIASRHQSTVCALVLANEISDPNKIFAGQELIVPVLP